MNFIDKQDRILFLFQRGNDTLQPLLEITPKFGPREHTAKIQWVDANIFDNVGHVPVTD